MGQKRRVRYILAFVMLTFLLLSLFILSINLGSRRIPVPEVLDVLIKREGENAAIIWDIRLPRVISAAVLGGALAVSGFLLQTFFANPIAGPFVLGVSSGAKLAVSVSMVTALSRGRVIGSALMIVSAFVGATVSMCFVLLASYRVKKMPLLIVCGVMTGYICSAITDFVVTFADDANIVSLHNWSQGSFSGISWENIRVFAPVILASLAGTFLMSKPISAYRLGEEYAQSVGVNVKTFRLKLILLSSVLSACVAAFAGPVSFVGIAVPHLTKSLLKSSSPLLMVPACFLGGAGFCVFCDLLARTLFSPVELNISSVTAVFGAPVVIYMLVRRRTG